MKVLFLLLHLVFFFVDAESQNQSNTSHPGDSISNFQPSLAVVIGMLSIMFSLTFILLLYAKFCHRTASPRDTRDEIQDGLLRSRPPDMGIEKAVIESLPLFKFSYLKGSRDGLECTVCLAKFEDVELLRLLPKCKHAFHMDCIDQWLENHSTCPLCRRSITADDVAQLPYSDSLRFLWLNRTELRQESNVELYVEREESHEGSSRFCIGSSFRKIPDKAKSEEELPIRKRTDSSDDQNCQPLHNLNHKIIISDVVFKNRWSNVSSSDLVFLNSEMLNDLSSSRFSSTRSLNEHKPVHKYDQLMNVKERAFESKVNEINGSDQHNASQFPGLQTASSFKQKPAIKSNAGMNHDKSRSVSEIIAYPRFTDMMRNRDAAVVQNDANKEERMRRLWLPIARKTVHWFANRERRPPQTQTNLV